MGKKILLRDREDIIPNHFIGGVGATSVTTEADYAARTDLLASDIKGFSIDVSNNVSFRVDIPYVFVGNVFASDSNITYLIDADGKATTSTTSLKEKQ